MANVCFTPQEIKDFGIDENISDEAALEMLREYEIDIVNSKRQARMQAIIGRTNEKIILSYINKQGDIDPQLGLEALIYRDRNEQSRIYNSGPNKGEGYGADLETMMRGIEGGYQMQLYDIMEKHAPKYFGLIESPEARNKLVKAIWGGDETITPEYAKFAQQWRKLAEELRDRFNRAGGDVKYLDDWNMPQTHDEFKLRKAIKDTNISVLAREVEELLDLKRMDLEANTDATNMAIMQALDNIINEGAGQPKGKGRTKVANRHQEKRFFQFKDADSWLAYHNKYGKGNPYNTMTDYVSMMTHEIGLMETLGPNPRAAFENLVAVAKEEAPKLNEKYHQKALNSTVVENSFANLSGATSAIDQKMSDYGKLVRSITSGLKLPMAVVTAMPDTIMNAMTARYAFGGGLKSLKATFKTMLTPLPGQREANRELASKLHMNLDFMIDAAHSANRYLDVQGQGGAAKFAGFILKAGGLNHWTVAQKMGFHFSFMQELATPGFHTNKQTLQTFERYGIGKSDIAAIKAAGKIEKNGAKYMDPSTLPPKVAEKVVGMVQQETRIAINEADSRVRGLLNRGTNQGTVPGELLRLVTMFKTFPTSVVMHHWARALHGTAHGSLGKAGYSINLLVGTTILGALSLQLKQISLGEDPHPWGSKKFWTEAMYHGGAMSIFGDMLQKEARTYGSAGDFVVGPAGGLIGDLMWDGLLGTMDDAMNTDKTLTEIARSGTGNLAKYVPGQFVYFKWAMNRAFLDGIRRFGDPEYDLKKIRRDAKKDEEYDREWW